MKQVFQHIYCSTHFADEENKTRMGIRCLYISSHVRIFSFKNTTLWKEVWAEGVPDVRTVLFIDKDADYTGVFNKIIHPSIYTYDLQTLPDVTFQWMLNLKCAFQNYKLN